VEARLHAELGARERAAAAAIAEAKRAAHEKDAVLFAGAAHLAAQREAAEEAAGRARDAELHSAAAEARADAQMYAHAKEKVGYLELLQEQKRTVTDLQAREAEAAEAREALVAAGEAERRAAAEQRAAAAAQAQAWAAERAELQAQLGQLRAAAQPATPFARRDSAGAAVSARCAWAPVACVLAERQSLSRHTSGLCCLHCVPGDRTGIGGPLACRPHMLSCVDLPCRDWLHSSTLSVQLAHGRRRLRGDRARDRRARYGRGGRAGGCTRRAAGRAARERPQARQLAAAGRRGAPRARAGRRLRQARARRRPRRQPGAAGDAAGACARRGRCIFGGVNGACPLAPCMLHGQALPASAQAQQLPPGMLPVWAGLKVSGCAWGWLPASAAKVPAPLHSAASAASCAHAGRPRMRGASDAWRLAPPARGACCVRADIQECCAGVAGEARGGRSAGRDCGGRGRAGRGCAGNGAAGAAGRLRDLRAQGALRRAVRP